MGRKKISITRLSDERNRQITFSKRKAGLLKKAYELSILCDVEIAVIMITSNSKLYQYASSNMNSILIQYTDFKDPDESKTNADILDDITKKERGGPGDDSGEEDASSQGYMVTPRTQESFRRIDKEFDHLLHTNQVPPPSSSSAASVSATVMTPLGSASPSIPNVMPVTVPVGYSPNTVQQQIQQHLQTQMGPKSSSISADISSGSLPSAATSGSMFSPQSELSSSSPMSGGHLRRSPTNMPPPMTTPTRLQTLRNQTLKLHLPGSGRNYISLSTGVPNQGGSGDEKRNGPTGDPGEAEEEREEGEGGGGGGGRPGTKPQLRVYIPGQKEFVPRTQQQQQDASPLPQQVSGTLSVAGGGSTVPHHHHHHPPPPPSSSSSSLAASSTATNTAITSTAESLTTPVLSLTTPNIFSSLPPIFSSLLGDFPFGGHTPGGGGTGGGGTGTTGGGGGSGDSSSAALVAFPVSIQPSATGGSGTGNLILQAQNMGQPFLLTPTKYDSSRQNPLFTSQGMTPPTSGLTTSLTTGLSPNLQNIEILKQQYERTQQMIQQQLLYSQMQMQIQQQQHKQQQQQQQQQNKEGGGAGMLEGEAPVSTIIASSSGSSTSPRHTRLEPSRDPSRRLGSSDGIGVSSNHLPQYINGSDVMMSSQTQSQSRPMARTRPIESEEEEEVMKSSPPDKKTRLDASPSPV